MFKPSLRLLVAFQQRPELFRDFRNANFEYLRDYAEDEEDITILWSRFSRVRHKIYNAFPMLEEELGTLEGIWDTVDGG